MEQEDLYDDTLAHCQVCNPFKLDTAILYGMKKNKPSYIPIALKRSPCCDFQYLNLIVSAEMHRSLL